MEEVIIVIRIEYFDIYEEKTCEYAMSFNVSNAVYLALLTGGEPAIKSYYRSNGFGDREKKILARLR